MIEMAAACFNIRSVESCTAARLSSAPHTRKGSFNIRSVESCTAAAHSKAVMTGHVSFNIRSVESCTAALILPPTMPPRPNVSIFALSNRVLLLSHIRSLGGTGLMFQYSLCRIVYCCLAVTAFNRWVEVVSIFALSNRVLLPIS